MAKWVVTQRGGWCRLAVACLCAFCLSVCVCTKRPSKEELTKLEEVRNAAENAERKLAELREERRELERTLEQKQEEVRQLEKERDELRATTESPTPAKLQ